MLEQLNDWNWEEAFKYAAYPTGVEGFAGSTAGFTREDVAEIVAIVDGENDGADWVGVFRLNDGRFASLSAGCDYTGWGCQEFGTSRVARTREEIIRFGLTVGDRQRLGLLLPGESMADA